MKKYLLAAAAATVFAATPALAQDAAAGSTFTGPRIGVNVGFTDDNIFGTESFTYGAEAGYDFAVGNNAVLGLTAEIQDSKDITRELALTGRAGAKVGNNGLLYVTGGYSNLRAFGENIDGFRLGVGGELAIGSNAFAKIEQRYGNYQYGIDLWQTAIGVGFRF